MKDERKTKEQLINELVALRQRIAELETPETQRKRAEEALRRSLEETARGQRLLLALGQAAQAVQRARTPDEVYRAVGDEIARLGYHALVLTVTDDRAHLVLSHVTFKPALVQAVEKLTGIPAQDYRFPLVLGGSYQQLIAEGKTAFTEQVAERIAEILPAPVRPLAGQVAARLGLQQSIATLLRAGGETHGLLVVAGTGLTKADVPAMTAFANQAAIAIENARLYQAERKQAAQLAVVSQVARRAASILDMDQLLQEAATAIQQSFHYYHVGLFLLDEVAGELKMRAIAGGFEDVAPPDHRLAWGEGMVGWTAETGQSLLANDVSQEPRYVPGILKEALTKAELCLPLKLAGQVIGVLDIQSTRLNAFDETDLRAMETLADQLAVAIENAQLYQETVQRLQEAETLSAITTTLTRSLDLDQVLQSIVDSATRLIPTGTGGVIHLVDEATGKLIPRAASAPEVNVREKYLEMSIGEGTAGLVVQEKRLINVPNVEKVPHFLIVDTASAKKSLLTAPLLMDKDCLGALSLNSDQVSAFSANDEWLLTTLAAQAAVAVRNARLFEQAQREIAERKQAEGALRKAKEFSESLIASMQDGFSVLDSHGVHIDVNPALCQMTGFSREELIGVGTPHPYWAPEAYEEIEGVFQKTLGGEFADLELTFMRKNGERFPVIVSPSWIEDEQGNVISYFATVKDITERKRIEKVLEKERQELKLIIDSSPIIVFYKDKEGKLLRVNKTFAEALKMPEEDFIGKTVFDLYSSKIAQGMTDDDLEILKSGRPKLNIIEQYESASGIRWVQTDKIPICDKNGIAVGLIGFAQDITERKQAEEALRESEERYRNLIETSPDSIFIVDHTTGNFIAANPAASQLYGYSNEEFLRMNTRDVSAEPEKTAAAVRDGTTQVPLRLHRQKEGTIFPVEITGSHFTQGGRNLYTAFIRDITERKRAEDALQKSEEKFRSLAENSQDYIMRYDSQCRHLYENPAALRASGLTLEQLVGKTHRELGFDEALCELWEAKIAQVFKTGEVTGEIFTWDSVEGPLTLDWRLFPEFDQEGKVKTVLGVSRDITAQVRAEEALRETTQTLQAVFQASPLPIFAMSRERSVKMWNPAAERIFGWGAQEVLGRQYPAIPKEKMDEADALFLRALEGGLTGVETRRQRKDGSLIDVSISAAPLRDGRGNITGVMVVIADITERKRAEEEIRQRSRELAALLEASQRLAGRLDLDELLDAVAHSIVDTLPTAEAASLWLYDERRNELVVRAWAGHDDKAISGLALSPKTSLVGLVYHSHQPQMIDDVPSEPAFELLGHPTLDAVRSVLGVPLLVEGRPIGALFADNFSRPQAFSQNDARLLQSLASQATIAIENARLLDAVTKHRGDLQSLSTQLINAQEAERKRISQGLHDEMGQALTAMSINLAAVEKELPPELAPTIRERLAETSSLADQTLEQIRELSLDLRPSLLDDLGLVPTLRWYVNRYAKRMDIEVQFEAIDLEERLTAETETALYRTVQEALTNAARHAQASRVRIRLERQESKISAFIEDDGRGFDVQEAADREPSKRGAGLLGIRERVTSLGGRFRIRSRPGRGTRLTLEIPL